MSVNCGLAQSLVKKFDYLEKRVTYLERKSKGQQDVIEKLQTKLKKFKKIAKNRGKLSQEKPAAKPNPDLIEEIGSIPNEPLNIMKNDPKISQKLVIQMGVRCDEKSQEISNPVEKSVKNGHSSKICQSKTVNNPRVEVKNEEISSKPKVPAQKSHICTYCLKSFRDFSNLSDHLRVHTGERPFKCKTCSKTFTLMTNLKRHNLVHTDLKPFTCSVCSKAFTQSSNLKIHMRIHSGEKPYSCSFCSKGFTKIQALNEHIRAHIGERPYFCSVCSKTFKHTSAFSRHKKIHKHRRSV